MGGGGYTVVLFIFLSDISLLVVVLPFRVYFFILVYFFASLFSPPLDDTKMAMAASRKITVPIPVIPLLNNDGKIFTYFILHNPLCLLWGQNLPTHDLLNTSLPSYLL